MHSSNINAKDDLFYKTLIFTGDSDFLADLNFKYNNKNIFNQDLSGSIDLIDISILHFNVRSLNKNYMNLFATVDFDVIVVSEIWNTNVDLYYYLFNGYTFYWDKMCIFQCWWYWCLCRKQNVCFL